jgi:pimeloyl-ACP methyl ester carboxylesterase
VSSYDEFGLFHENIGEWGLNVAIPEVRRVDVAVDGLRSLSALVWGDSPPELALVHGSAQNAHTFDTVALALERPLVALDLPGHGHSDGSPFPRGAIRAHANDIARALPALVEGPRPLVGMSLGGLVSIVVAHDYPALVSQLILIDVTPGITPEKARHITNFVNGPRSFADFDALLERTIEHNPTRTASSLRRGILHNAVQMPDGSWVWRHQRHDDGDLEAPPVGDLWDMLENLSVPVTLIRGLAASSVVDDADVAELQRRCPQAHVFPVEGAGHSVQGDQPLVLAALLNRLVG